MSRYNHKDVSNVLDASSALTSIVAKAKLLNKLNTTVRAILPDNLKNHCEVANVRNNQLIISAENSAWATKIRYQSTEIISALRDILPSLANIKVIIKD